MATIPTSLPIPSEDPRDLKFNAGRFDEVINSLSEKFTDRFGAQRYTVEGLKLLVLNAIYNLGLNPVGTFQAGATLNSANDIIQDTTTFLWYRWDDVSSLPKVVPSGSTPASTGGIAAGAWQAVDVSDVLRRDLISSSTGKGDSLVAVKQPFTGTFLRTQHDKNTEILSIKDFLDPLDTNYDLAFSRASSAIVSANVELYLPSGDYIFTQSLSIALTTTKNLLLRGDGSGVTRLFFRGAANGISIATSTSQEWNGGSIHVKGISLISDNINSGTALNINQMQITGIPAGKVITEDVIARGENTHTQQWAAGIIYNRTSGTTTRDVEIYGYAGSVVGDGIIYLGTSDDISTQHVMDNVRLWFLNRPTVANQYIQGLFYDKVNVFNCNYALAWDASAVSTGQTELHIVNSQFTVNSVGFNLTKIGYITGSNNMFISNNQNTSVPSIFIRLNGCFEYSFVANNFYGGSLTQNIAFEIANSVPVATDQAHYNGLIALNTFDSLVDAYVIGADSVSPRIWRNIYTPSVTNIIANNSSSPVVKEDSVFQYTGVVTFGASNALQRITVAVPAGLFRQQPELATIHWNGDYVMFGNFLASESSATSLVFGIRRYDGTAFTGGPFSYSIRASS